MKLNETKLKLKQINEDVGDILFDKAYQQIKQERYSPTTKRKRMTEREKIRLYALQNGECARCGNMSHLQDLTDDHIIPISKGGTNDKKNRRLVCKSCNSKKGNNLPIEESKLTGKTILEQLG